MNPINPALYEIRVSKMLEGEVSLFAIRPLPKGALVVREAAFEETLEPWSTYDATDEGTRKLVDKFCLQTADGFWMPRDFNRLPVCYFMNHSCDPNVGFDQDNFVALRDIQAGEELCWDFGAGVSDPKFKLECRCNSPRCRKVVTGNDWQLPELQERYDGWFQAFLQEKINAMRGR